MSTTCGYSENMYSLGVLPLVCRFSDAGYDNADHKLRGRRRKSAKARNRGEWGHRRCRGLYEDLAAASGWARLDRIARPHRRAWKDGCGWQAERAEQALPKRVGGVTMGRLINLL